jgi:hypothetical protein
MVLFTFSGMNTNLISLCFLLNLDRSNRLLVLPLSPIPGAPNLLVGCRPNDEELRLLILIANECTMAPSCQAPRRLNVRKLL